MKKDIISNFDVMKAIGRIYLKGNPTGSWDNVEDNYFFDSYFEFNKEILN